MNKDKKQTIGIGDYIRTSIKASIKGDISTSTVISIIIILITMVVLLYIIIGKFNFVQGLWDSFFGR